MSRDPDQPPPAPGPEAGPAKPAAPGPKEPPSIAKSILPQRQQDAERHDGDAARPPEAVSQSDEVVAAQHAAVETARADRDAGQRDDD
jgi:hypothetical protein